MCNTYSATDRPPGVVYDFESSTLIAGIDHFCPWSATTITKSNYRPFQFFVVAVFVHMGAVFLVAIPGVIVRAVNDCIWCQPELNATTMSPTFV